MNYTICYILMFMYENDFVNASKIHEFILKNNLKLAQSTFIEIFFLKIQCSYWGGGNE